MQRFQLLRLLLLAFATQALWGCVPEDERMFLPPAGEVQTSSVTMGQDYDDMIFFDFSTGQTVTAKSQSFDLLFTSRASDRTIYLNTSKLMFAWNTEETDFEAIDIDRVRATTAYNWFPDSPHMMPDSTAIGRWWNENGTSKQLVYVLDRGEVYYTRAADRYRKMQIVSADEKQYVIRVAKLDGSDEQQLVVPKDTSYSFVHVSLGQTPGVVTVAPPKQQWDVVFTRYTHIYLDQPVESGFRYYSVAGVLTNIVGGAGSAVLYDSLPGTKPFMEFSVQDLPNVNIDYMFADRIGFEWKGYDFTLGFIVYTNRYYLVKDHTGTAYKLKFFDFYSDQGIKGTPKFQYQRL